MPCSSNTRRADMPRYGAKVQDGVVVDVLVLADGPKGDEAVAAFNLVEQDGVLPGVGWTWDGEAFVEPAPQPDPLTFENVQKQRAARYAAESDFLFFRWQRGEGTEAEWTAAVDAIRADLPYPS